jgi:RimJ/RimL family protein N-acetyltransferase
VPQSSRLGNAVVTLDPVNEDNVDLLVGWTLDPIAQGPYKRVPSLTSAEIRSLFLDSLDRWYFLIRRTDDAKPLGRFYYRAWQFHPEPQLIDYELNLFIAEPAERGKGYGSSAQSLAAEFLLGRAETHSVFAYTLTTNVAEQAAVKKAGFQELGLMPSEYYRVDHLPPTPCILYARFAKNNEGGSIGC